MGLSAIAQARLVRDGQVSSTELVRQTLDRIEELNPRYQAFVSVFDRAIAVARRKDRIRRRTRGDLPLFHGVPLGVKDLNVVRWTKTRYGSRAVPHLPLPFDDHTVAPLRRAGFVIVGKLSTSEFGAMPVTEPEIHPPTRNPWAPDHTSGGSSGGSAAADAAAGELVTSSGFETKVFAQGEPVGRPAVGPRVAESIAVGGATYLRRPGLGYAPGWHRYGGTWGGWNGLGGWGGGGWGGGYGGYSGSSSHHHHSSHHHSHEHHSSHHSGNHATAHPAGSRSHSRAGARGGATSHHASSHH